MAPGPQASHGQQQQTQPFTLWQPGWLDTLRKYLLSERFQSATQLTVGVLFVSLFVFVEALRFPGSCVSVLLFFVIAVTGAPDCHIGTRIFLCGFMMGPMWLSLLLGGIIATLGKLAPNKTAELVVEAVLGSVALIPFAINRVGTSHLYMFAMGMISCLYLGMPILSAWPAPTIALLWERAVGFILVAALVAMFAGSVLSMIVLPTLASHRLEDEVSTALKHLGQHLSACASHLWRPGRTTPQALPPHLAGLHPLLLQRTDAPLGPLAPGLRDIDVAGAAASPREVYSAFMDWFEHLSRPASDSAAKDRLLCFAACRTSSASDGAGSERAKSTFYGRSTAHMAAAVAAAAQDAEEEEQWQQQQQQQQQQQEVGDIRASIQALPRFQSWSGRLQATGSTTDRLRWRQRSTPPAPSAAAAAAGSPEAQLPDTAAAGAAVSAESTEASPPDKALRFADSTTAEGYPVSKSVLGSAMLGRQQPAPTITEVRQLLAHANQLLDASGAEPQWLRSGERPFHVKPWRQLVAAAQLVATRITALDLLQRDFASLQEEPHSFQMADCLVLLLQQLYGSAAAALALVSEQIKSRQGAQTCEANQQILKRPEWQEARQQLLTLLEGTLAEYYTRVQHASPEDPVTLPSAPWVRRWMFFHTTTLSLVDALDNLANASQAALTTPPQQQHKRWWKCWGSQQQQQQQLSQQQQPLASTQGKVAMDIEAGAGAKVPCTQAHPTQDGADPAAAHGQAPHKQQHVLSVSSDGATATPATGPGAALLGSLTSMQAGSNGAPVAAAAAAASDAALAEEGIAAGPPGQQQHSNEPLLLPSPVVQRQQLQQPLLLSSPLAQQQQQRSLVGYLQDSFRVHTAWVRPWLPLALNVQQFENLWLVAKQVPAACSSRQAFMAALRKRRVQAAIKYWAVLVVVMVGTLLVMYFVPQSARWSPSFGYTAACVGMSDRVESTVFKVFVWTGATIVGALVGWALMASPAMALNSVALGAVMCAAAFIVGSFDRGPDNTTGLLSLFTLTTLASIVLCQCCGRLGLTAVSLARGASVIIAAVIAVSVQNLILPWYTSTWALEQLGGVFKESTEVLADLVCQLHEDTRELLLQSEQDGSSSGGGGTPADAAAAVGPAAATAAAASATAAAGSAVPGGPQQQPGSTQQLSGLQKLQLLEEAVGRVWLREQQQLEQGQQPVGRQRSVSASVASSRLAGLGRMLTTSSQQDATRQPSRTAAATGAPHAAAAPAVVAAADMQQQASQGLSSRSVSAAAGSPVTAAGTMGAAGAGHTTSTAAALTYDGLVEGDAALAEMVQLLQQRKQSRQQQGLGPGRVSVTGPQLQARLIKPLVQVKISLILDTTAWRSGLLATPPLVLEMVQAMFDLVDALAALQQAVSMPVNQLSGSWDWMLLRAAGAWAALILQAMQLADATAAHMTQPSPETVQELLMQIQEVQHKRFEYFALKSELRRLLHTALVADEELSAGCLTPGVDEWQLQGCLRYSASVYAVSKVLDRITAAARIALKGHV